ncbi:MAG: corrinoid protein [Deltaproteobacteria bacterium]|nr:corrinoid protein [Deltaproteobacteria bacterium]
MANYEKLIEMIQQGDFSGCANLVKELVQEGSAPNAVIQEGIGKALNIVGQKFSEGECFIPEMLIAAKAAQTSLDALKPALAKAKVQPKGKIVIGTVHGDLHDIGKNIVAMILSASGFQVIDLGVDVPAQKFVDTLKGERSRILALSCLITTTMPAMESTVKAVKDAGLSGQVKIMIGGPSTTDDFARKIGADFRGHDAYEALNQAERWTKN